jgi:hypothetical protein
MFGTTEQAAEKGLLPSKSYEKQTSGAKAHICFVAFAARLKPCPDTKLAQF